jgi:hypothetical protein
MTANFDASAKATEIENLARTNLDHQLDPYHPIESSAIASQADRNLRAEFTELQNNPDQLLAVGKALEQDNGSLFSVLPRVKIEAEDGKMTAVTFAPVAWDPKAPRLPVQERVDFGK